MFRCAQGNFMVNLFLDAGLKNIAVREVSGTLKCKTADVYWNVMTELAAPVVAAFSKAGEETKLKIRNEVTETVNQKYPDGNVMIGSSALIVYGEKMN